MRTTPLARSSYHFDAAGNGDAPSFATASGRCGIATLHNIALLIAEADCQRRSPVSFQSWPASSGREDSVKEFVDSPGIGAADVTITNSQAFPYRPFRALA
jgi:hypothetical protein